MTDAAQRLLEEALKLDPDERARFVLRLAESLDEPFDEDADAAWAKVIARRVEEVCAGTAKIVSVEEAVERARKRIERVQ